MQTNHFESLSELELEQASGGGLVSVAVKAAKKHAPEIIATIAGAVAGWLSE